MGAKTRSVDPGWGFGRESAVMNLKFWGVRGSIPSPSTGKDIDEKLRAFIDVAQKSSDRLSRPDEFLKNLPRHLLHPVGGNTSCLEVKHNQSRIILDMGSGLRPLGVELSPKIDFGDSDLFPSLNNPPPFEPDKGLDLVILLSHTHWDHIQGFPFFTPAHNAANRITIYGQDGDKIRRALNIQQTAPSLFPISLNGFEAEIVCRSFPEREMTLGDIEIRSMPLPHPGGSLAFKLKTEDRIIIYATDYEFPSPEGYEADQFVKFIEGADVFISDTQYTYLEGVAREGWGHSTSFGAVDLAMRAGVKSLYLFHHDPDHSDAKLYDSLDKTRAYYMMLSGNGQMTIDLGVEGLII